MLHLSQGHATGNVAAEHLSCIEGGMQMNTEVLRAAVEKLIQNGRKTLVERTAEAAHLTEREVDVLRLMGNGDLNKTIAAALGISLDTQRIASDSVFGNVVTIFGQIKYRRFLKRRYVVRT